MVVLGEAVFVLVTVDVERGVVVVVMLVCGKVSTIQELITVSLTVVVDSCVVVLLTTTVFRGISKHLQPLEIISSPYFPR